MMPMYHGFGNHKVTPVPVKETGKCPRCKGQHKLVKLIGDSGRLVMGSHFNRKGQFCDGVHQQPA
jgi:hypothetical protein